MSITPIHDSPSARAFRYMGPTCMCVSLLFLHCITTFPSLPFSFLCLFQTIEQTTPPKTTTTFLSTKIARKNEAEAEEQHDALRFPIWVLLPHRFHNLSRRCFSNASSQEESQPTGIFWLVRLRPLQVEVRCLLRRQTGHPDPNRPPKPPRHAPGNPPKPYRVAGSGASSQQHHRSASESQRVELTARASHQ